MFLTEENKQILIRNLKVLALNLGFMGLAVLADFGAHNIGLLNISSTQAAFIGVLLAQVSTWANQHFNVAGRVAKYFARKSRG